MLKEGIFRKPRLKTNKILKKYSYLFKGDVINVSGSSDKDKDCSFFDYYFGDYNNGKTYKNYFVNADSYVVSNYPGDKTDYDIEETKMIYLDLEKEVPNDLMYKFDVVFNHTVLEHVFNIQKAFANLCSLSKDIVILIVPQSQMVHDYKRGYKDYWRFTPFVIDKLFEENGMKVLYRETTFGFSESMYLFYIASKRNDKWKEFFPKLKPLDVYLTTKNNGSLQTLFSFFLIRIDFVIRFITSKFKK